MNQEQTTDTVFAEGEQDFEGDIAALASRARETIEEFVKDQPHVALGLAAAAGFVLGGGLTPRRLLRLGFAVGGPALTKQFSSQMLRFASQAVEHQLRGDHESPSPSRKESKGRTRSKKDKETKENG